MSVGNAEQWFQSHNDIKNETLFDEDIIGTVSDVVHYEDDPGDDDPVKVAKLPLRIKALVLVLSYV